MINHVVVFTFVPDATAEQVQAVRDRLSALPAIIPEIRSFCVVDDLRLREGNGDMAVLAAFDTPEDFLTYTHHPDHQAVITDVIRPVLASRSALQYEG